jgi:hypothetical protein
MSKATDLIEFLRRKPKPKDAVVKMSSLEKRMDSRDFTSLSSSPEKGRLSLFDVDGFGATIEVLTDGKDPDVKIEF